MRLPISNVMDQHSASVSPLPPPAISSTPKPFQPKLSTSAASSPTLNTSSTSAVLSTSDQTDSNVNAASSNLFSSRSSVASMHQMKMDGPQAIAIYQRASVGASSKGKGVSASLAASHNVMNSIAKQLDMMESRSQSQSSTDSSASFAALLNSAMNFFTHKDAVPPAHAKQIEVVLAKQFGSFADIDQQSTTSSSVEREDELEEHERRVIGRKQVAGKRTRASSLMQKKSSDRKTNRSDSENVDIRDKANTEKRTVSAMATQEGKAVGNADQEDDVVEDAGDILEPTLDIQKDTDHASTGNMIRNDDEEFDESMDSMDEDYKNEKEVEEETVEKVKVQRTSVAESRNRSNPPRNAEKKFDGNTIRW